MKKAFFVSSIIITILNSGLFPKIKMPTIEMAQKRIESKLKDATKLTKDNINRFVKKAKNALPKNINIKNKLFQSNTRFLRESEKIKNSIKWGTDYNFLKELEDAHRQSKTKTLELLHKAINTKCKGCQIPLFSFSQEIKNESEQVYNLLEKVTNFLNTKENTKLKKDIVLAENINVEFSQIYNNIEKIISILNDL